MPRTRRLAQHVSMGLAGVDSPNVWSRTQRYAIGTIPYAATINFNATAANVSGEQKITLTGDVTAFSVSNMVEPQYLTIDVYQDATGGRTITWSGIGGTAPALNAAANSRTSIVIKQTANGPVFASSPVTPHPDKATHTSAPLNLAAKDEENQWVLPQLVPVQAVAAEATLSLDGSMDQSTTLTANRTLSFSGSVPANTTCQFRLHVAPNGFNLTLPAAVDPFGRWIQPSTTAVFLIGFNIVNGTPRYVGVV